MPRGRSDPFHQVADGGRFHLVPGLQILEQDRAQLDEAQRRLAPGDDGVHAGAVRVVRADATVAVAVERGGVAARAAVTLAGDQIDERCFLGLLHGLPFSVLGARARIGSGGGWVCDGAWGPCIGGFWHSIRGQSPIAKREIVHRDDGPLRAAPRGPRTTHPRGSTGRGRQARGASHPPARPDRSRAGSSVSANPRP